MSNILFNKPAEGETEKNEYRKMPKPIDASPEQVAKAIMQGPPKKHWRFQQNKRR